MRGTARTDIFYDDEDYSRFLQTLEIFTKKLDIKLMSYTFMSNHVHMVVKKEGEKEIGTLISSICSSYVQHYFNKKYDRVGSLFQSRFISKPLENDAALAEVTKYIANNPRKAGIANADAYVYSAYDTILRDFSYRRNTSFLDTSLIRKVFGKAKNYEKTIRDKYEPLKACDEDYPPQKQECRELMGQAAEGLSLIDRLMAINSILLTWSK
jgi:REP element-mobilizing transposase RayT